MSDWPLRPKSPLTLVAIELVLLSYFAFNVEGKIEVKI
jgi:hypothetical protein